MTVIKQEDFIQSIFDAFQFISYYHPKDYIQALYKAYQKEENPAAKDAMAQILVNSRMCAEGHRPICQDTGIATVFLKVGMDVQWDAEMSVQEMVNEAYAVHTPILTTNCAPPYWPTRLANVKIPKTTRLPLYIWKS